MRSSTHANSALTLAMINGPDRSTTTDNVDHAAFQTVSFTSLHNFHCTGTFKALYAAANILNFDVMTHLCRSDGTQPRTGGGSDAVSQHGWQWTPTPAQARKRSHLRPRPRRCLLFPTESVQRFCARPPVQIHLRLPLRTHLLLWGSSFFDFDTR